MFLLPKNLSSARTSFVCRGVFLRATSLPSADESSTCRTSFFGRVIFLRLSGFLLLANHSPIEGPSSAEESFFDNRFLRQNLPSVEESFFGGCCFLQRMNLSPTEESFSDRRVFLWQKSLSPTEESFFGRRVFLHQKSLPSTGEFFFGRRVFLPQKSRSSVGSLSSAGESLNDTVRARPDYIVGSTRRCQIRALAAPEYWLAAPG